MHRAWLRTLLPLWAALALPALVGMLGCDSGDDSPREELARSDDGALVLHGDPAAVPAGASLGLAGADPAALPDAPQGLVPVSAIDCTPDGIVFGSPVTLTVTLPAALTANAELPVYRLVPGAWQTAGCSARVADDGLSASFPVSRFDTYGLFRAPGSAYVALSSIFRAGDAIAAADNHPTWSPDGEDIVFLDGNGGLQRVSARAGATPEAVTAAGLGLTNRLAPRYIAANEVAFWTGWVVLSDGGPVQQDRDMHIVAVDLTDNALRVVQQFNGEDVGLARDQAIAPDELALSADGSRGIGIWSTGVWLMDFPAGTFTRIAERLQLRHVAISPDGTLAAYDREDGHVYTHSFAGAVTDLGVGRRPSFAADGDRIGFVREHGYILRSLSAGTSKVYPLADWLVCRDPVLSPNATSFVYRNGTQTDGSADGLSLGRLLDA